MRHSISLNEDWRFCKSISMSALAMDERWEHVNLPHTWNALDGQDGGNDYFRGKCCYARVLRRSDLPRAEKYYLEFLGANSSAVVAMNGQELAWHDGGYSTWRVEITEALKEESHLFVLVDNAANGSVYPQNADFTFYGGLYRGVNLICVPRSHFTLDDFGTPGLKITPALSGSDADVEIEAFVTGAQPGQQLLFSISDGDGREIASQTLPVCETKAKLRIPNVRRWHGRRDPYLYTASIALMEGGEILDQLSSPFGCRSFHIDPERGFFLNGESYPLRGVSRHQDWKGIGNALLPEHHERDMELICEMGANTIRLAHYQHDQYFYDLCDRAGMIVWAEIPYISSHMPDGVENTLSQLRELITQNYNHPSIAVWGISNEITIGGSTPELLENHRRLNELAHTLDPTRKTVLAAVSMCDIHDPVIHLTDAVSYNHYFGWYGGDTSMNGPWLDKFHETFPSRPIGLSEYGCEALNWHSSDPQQGDYTEEYQAHYHEELIRQLFTRPYIWATHVWSMFDFGADARNEGGENGQNHKGLVTFDRAYKKDAFYAYKAWLSSEPFVHICGKRYVDRAEDVTRVTVYSNQPEVELFANGESLGRQAAADHFFYFDVPLSGETALAAVAGDCRDESRIRRVERFNEDYRLKEQGAILNWFDISAPQGRYCLNDRMGEILKSEAAREAIAPLFASLDDAQAGLSAGEQVMNMLSGFTVLRFANLAAGMLNIAVSKEQLLEINARLNEIPKA